MGEWMEALKCGPEAFFKDNNVYILSREGITDYLLLLSISETGDQTSSRIKHKSIIPRVTTTRSLAWP